MVVALVAVGLVTAWIATRHEPAPVPVPYSGPALHPAPQHISGSGIDLDLSGRVTVVAADGADPVTVDSLTALLGEVAREVGTAPSAADAASGSTVILVGTWAEGGPLATALDSVKAAAEDGPRMEALGRPEGYVLATGTLEGHPAAILAGADAHGSFYAVQSLRDLLAGGRLAAVSVADWPLMATRGVIEGFYGTPWTDQARSDVLSAMGRAKMNTFFYSPKDDPFARERWRDLYTSDGAAGLRNVVALASRNHINVAYALSPGLDICYSRASDLDAAVAKIDSLYDLGIRTFIVPFDDISGSFRCRSDQTRFTAPGDGGALAQAQASFLNSLRDRLTADHPDLSPLQMVPTNYSGTTKDAYKTRLGRDLDPRIVVQWTGPEVVSHRISGDAAQTAQTVYGGPGKRRPVLIWDNFPVNDFAPEHLFLAPVEGRDPDLYKYVVGMVSNPMPEAYASLPGIATFADMTWNGADYRPYEALDAALVSLAGGDSAALSALRAFTDLNQNWQLDDLVHPAPALSRDVDAFWSAYRGGTPLPSGLADRARILQQVPELLTQLKGPGGAGYAADVAPWSAAAADYGAAMAHALDMLAAVRSNDEAAARSAEAALTASRTSAVALGLKLADGRLAIPATGDGVAQRFLDDALAEFNAAYGN